MSRKTAIDLGTSTLQIYVDGKGVVLNEPSVIAVDKYLNKVTRVGREAVELIGREPEGIEVVRPIRDGVISRFSHTVVMLKRFYAKACGRTLLPPSVVITVPSIVTDVEEHAVRDAAVIDATEDPDPARLSVLRVSVPVNLRPFYGSRTLRNFASYVNLGVDVKDGYLPFGELVHRIRVQKREMLRRENLEPKIAANVSLEENVAVRCIPLFIKKPVIDAVNRHHGDRYFSQTLSSLGRVELPESMRPYVVDFDFILGRQRNNAGATTCTTCGDRLHIHFSRSIADDRFERGVVALFHELGFRVEVVHGILA